MFDETRNRFVYPQDKSFIVYFEWTGPSGLHVLTGIWKGPDGRTISMSPEIKMETQGPEFAAYWTYEIFPGVPGGIWTLEVRIDGEPAGAHSFEMIVPQETSPPAPQKKARTLDELFRLASSLVWVHKLDAAGRRVDTGSGFVISANRVATAFQCVDAATRLEIEFEGGRKVPVEELTAWNRLEDWVLIRVDTAGVVPLPRGDPKEVPVGERLVVFNFEAGARVIGGIDIAGRRKEPGFGERFQLSPSPVPEAAGGPLLNAFGEVVGIVGGSLAPGSRFQRRDMSLSPALWVRLRIQAAATPINLVPEMVAGSPATLSQLMERGALTPPLHVTPAFVFGGTTNRVSNNPADPMPSDVSEFSRKEPEVWVYTVWQRKEKIGKGMVAATVFDMRNRKRVVVSPRKVTLPSSAPLRHAFSFSPASLDAGIYRIDILWDGEPVWRTFFSIID